METLNFNELSTLQSNLVEQRECGERFSILQYS